MYCSKNYFFTINNFIIFPLTNVFLDENMKALDFCYLLISLADP